MTLIHQSGVGQTTGTRYQLTQVNPFAVNFFDPNGESTGVIRFRVTQQGGGVIFHNFDVAHRGASEARRTRHNPECAPPNRPAEGTRTRRLNSGGHHHADASDAAAPPTTSR
jgi:hypothetical protein